MANLLLSLLQSILLKSFYHVKNTWRRNSKYTQPPEDGDCRFVSILRWSADLSQSHVGLNLADCLLRINLSTANKPTK